MATDELRNKVLAYLKAHNALSLSTVLGGQPHSAAVFYVNQAFDLFFLSSPSSRHGEGLAENRQASATINEDYENWAEIKGLQLEGDVIQFGHLSECPDIAESFCKKFPDVSHFFKDPADMPDAVASKVAKVLFYRFRPRSIHYIDNSLGFGHREKLELEFIEDST
jgi:uncharacterized protein YhbP (UPF0306 family)